MADVTNNLGDALLAEQQRVRQLRLEYAAIGPAGTFGGMMLDQLLAKTERAVMERDPIAMLQCYQELQECK